MTLQARELKSVELDVQAAGVRLLFHEPHVNRYNTGRQVLPHGPTPHFSRKHPQPKSFAVYRSADLYVSRCGSSVDTSLGVLSRAESNSQSSLVVSALEASLCGHWSKTLSCDAGGCGGTQFDWMSAFTIEAHSRPWRGLSLGPAAVAATAA